MKEDEGLERAIYDGEEAKKLLSHPLFKRLLEQAEKDESLSMECLATVDPHDTKAIMDIQQDIRVARAIPLYIQEIISTGDVAYSEYKQAVEAN